MTITEFSNFESFTDTNKMTVFTIVLFSNLQKLNFYKELNLTKVLNFHLYIRLNISVFKEENIILVANIN